MLNDLASKNDLIWPYEKWPKMKFDQGLVIGTKGGHGIIRYQIVSYQPERLIEFEFSKPEGIVGTHRIEMLPKNENVTLMKHTIDAKANGLAGLFWTFVIRPLHDALIEDAFDKVENLTTNKNKITPWSPWVKFLRGLFK